LIELLQNNFKLQCLENMGVDNWDWYGEAIYGIEGNDKFPGYDNEVDKHIENELKNYEIKGEN